MAQLTDRISRRSLVLLVLLLLVALLACKKSGGDDETDRDDSSESDDAAKDDAAKDDAAKDDAANDEASGAFKVGDPVDVEWKGDWWKGEVKRVRAGPVYYVHYVGWGNEWDEWVGPRRIRARTAGSRTK